MIQHKNKKSVSLFFCMLFLIPLTLAEESKNSSVNFMIGLKDMESENWPPYGQQYGLGIELIVRNEDYPVAFVFQFILAEAEFNYYGREKSSSKEFNTGLRHEFINGGANTLYVEAGISFIQGSVSLEGSGIDPDGIFNESAFGTWVSAGNTWYRDNGSELGFKLLVSSASTDIPSGRRVNLGGVHYIFFTAF